MKKFRQLSEQYREEGRHKLIYPKNKAVVSPRPESDSAKVKLGEEVSTPPIGVRSLYTKMYAKHGGTVSKAKEAQSKAYAEVEKKHGKQMRDSLEAFHKKNMNEAVKDKFDIGEYDQEGDMAKSDLRSILANAKRVHDMLEDSDNLPEWVQSKITKAEDYISTVANYMAAEMNEAAESGVSKKKEEKFHMDLDKLVHKTFGHSPAEKKEKMKEEVELDELSNELLHRYKEKAADDARASDAKGDFKKGDKRFSGIVSATKKQFANRKIPKMNEEQQIDEISAQTKSSYVQKAKKEVEELKPHAQSGEYKDIAQNLIKKREKGIAMAKEEVELDEENKPTNPELWARAKAMAKSKFDVYPSAYANGWAAKWYKSKGGGWRSVNEENYEVTVMHTTKDGDKGEHTHKITNADSSRHAKNIALQRHEKMLNSKGTEVRGMATTTAKVVEAKEEPKSYSGEKGNMWNPTGKTAKHMATGKKTYEYAEVDKEGKRTGARHYKDIEGKHMGEAKEDDVPFKADKPKKVAVAGKYGAGYSTARHLARQAMQKQVEKMKKKQVKESLEESRKTEIVKEILKKKKETKGTDDKFNDDPMISNTITRNY